jgi:hypothetical protein
MHGMTEHEMTWVLSEATRNLERVMKHLPVEHQADFIAYADELSEPVEKAIVAMLGAGPHRFTNATEGELARFREDYGEDVGGYLLGLWRGRSAECLGRVLTRIRAVAAQLTVKERDELAAWILKLNEHEERALLWALARDRFA